MPEQVFKTDVGGNLEVSIAAAKGLKAAVTQSGIWFVGINSLPMLPAGNNFIGNVGIASFPPLARGSNQIGSVLQAGVWNVGVSRLPSFVDPTVGMLLTNAATPATGPTVVCNHAYKTFSFGLTGTGTAKIDLFASADGTIFVKIASFSLDSTKESTDGFTTGATSHTKFYAVITEMTGTPAINGSVMGVF